MHEFIQILKRQKNIEKTVIPISTQFESEFSVSLYKLTSEQSETV